MTAASLFCTPRGIQPEEKFTRLSVPADVGFSEQLVWGNRRTGGSGGTTQTGRSSMSRSTGNHRGCACS